MEVFCTRGFQTNRRPRGYLWLHLSRNLRYRRSRLSWNARGPLSTKTDLMVSLTIKLKPTWDKSLGNLNTNRFLSLLAFTRMSTGTKVIDNWLIGTRQLKLLKIWIWIIENKNCTLVCEALVIHHLLSQVTLTDIYCCLRNRSERRNTRRTTS